MKMSPLANRVEWSKPQFFQQPLGERDTHFMSPSLQKVKAP